MPDAITNATVIPADVIPTGDGVGTQAPVIRPLAGFFKSFWKFDDLTDSVGHNTLTNHGSVTFVPGKLGYAANFVATSSQYLSHTHLSDFDGATKVTLTYWLNGTAPALYPVLIGQNSSNSEWHINAWSTGNGGSYFYVGPANYGYDGVGPDGSWHQYIWVYDGTQPTNATKLILYRDGAIVPLTRVGTIPSSIPSGNSEFYVGGQSSSFSTAMIDALGYALKVPTTDQVTAIWNAGAGKEYPF